MSPGRTVLPHVLPWLRRVGAVLLVVALVEYVVLPQLLGAGDDLALLRSAHPVVLVLAVALEVSSLACFTLLTCATLPRLDRPGFATLLRVDLTGYGASHVLPGGGATAATLRFRLLTRAGVGGDAAFAGATVQTAAAVVTLVGVFAAGAALTLHGASSDGGLLTAGLVASALLVVVAAGAVLLVVRRVSTQARLHRWLTRWPRDRARVVEGAVGGLTDRLLLLARDPVLLVRTLGWATANWLLDAACLWCCLRAYGLEVHLGALLAAYGVVNLVAMLPLTPGGLGIVEGVLVPALVSVGAAAAPALLGVLTWRLLQYWFPIPLALATYASLRLGVLRHHPHALPPVVHRAAPVPPG